MALQQPSAPPRASSRVPAGTPRSGVIHVNIRHASHYTVVGNSLAQHRELSFTARGIALYIQSLPAGSPIGVKALAGRSTEGEIRVAAALRELEEHGYLHRRRERLATGQVVTRTYSYNSPGAALRQPPSSLPPSPPSPDEKPVRGPEPLPEPTPERMPEPEPEPAPKPELEPMAAPVRQEAVDLLARLRSDDPRLLLADRDVQRLAPGVSAWLERGAPPEAVRHALTADLPADLRHSAALIAYRLRTQIPPHLPATPATPAARPVRRPDPLQNCDGCERAFRAPGPGRCRDCPPDAETAAAPYVCAESAGAWPHPTVPPAPAPQRRPSSTAPPPGAGVTEPAVAFPGEPNRAR